MIVYRRSYKRTWVVSWLALPRWRSVEEELCTDSLLPVRLSWWWWDGEWQYHRCRLGMCPGGDWGYREHWANNRQNDGRKRIRSDSNGIKLYSVFLMSYTTYTRTRKKRVLASLSKFFLSVCLFIYGCTENEAIVRSNYHKFMLEIQFNLNHNLHVYLKSVDFKSFLLSNCAVTSLYHK